MSSKTIRRAFRWTAGCAVLAVIAIAAMMFFGRRPERELPKPEACPVVSNVIETIVRVFAPDGDYVRLDVRKVTCADFERRLKEVSPAATLWTPGNGDWLIVGAENGCSNTLERVMDSFAGVETVFSFPEVFANCVGTVGDVLQAFRFLEPGDGVVPELFVSKDIPVFDWLTDGDVDADIVKSVRQEMRSMQVVRRVVLEGAMLSREQKEDESIAKWTSAYRRSRNDTLLLERIEHLRRNAEVFYKVGKYGMACKCYETLIRIDSNDYLAMVNLGSCLKALGRREDSEAVFKRAESVRLKGTEPPKM